MYTPCLCRERQLLQEAKSAAAIATADAEAARETKASVKRDAEIAASGMSTEEEAAASTRSEGQPAKKGPKKVG